MIRLERITRRQGQATTEVQYAITSLSRRQGSATKLIELWRGHWAIENQLHWVRDTLWQEDRCRIKSPTGGHNMAAFRNAAINLLRLAKVPNLAAAVRENAYRVDRLLARLGIMKL